MDDQKPEAMKQVIVLRTDLKMRRGKEIAQGAHASLKATLENLEHPHVVEWLAGRFTKIAVGIESEEALLAVYQGAVQAELVAAIIEDSGLTEFDGVPTITCIAVGPGPVARVDELTRHLKLR